MILFVTDQVAGAEYLLPLLKRWRAAGRKDWSVLASSRSHGRFDRAGIECTTASMPMRADKVYGFLERSGAQLIVMSSSFQSELEEVVRNAAFALDVPIVQFVDYWSNYRKRFEVSDAVRGRQWLFPREILTLDAHAKEEMVADGLADGLIRVIGQPFFEERIVAGEYTSGARGHRLLVLTQPVRKYYGQSLGYDEATFLEGCLTAVESLGLDSGGVDILVHPDESPESYRELLASRKSSPNILQGEVDLGDYRIVLGMFSSMMVQSFLARVSTLCYTPTASREDMNALSRLGYTTRCTTRDELCQAIGACLENDRFLNEEGYGRLRRALIGSTDRLESYIDANVKKSS